MNKDEATYRLKTVYDDLVKEYPYLKIDTYRDGGSLAFVMPSDIHRKEIVMLAPVMQYEYDCGKKVSFETNSVQILEKGCVRFSDSYKTENVKKTIDISDGFREKEIVNALRERLDDTTADLKKKLNEILDKINTSGKTNS